MTYLKHFLDEIELILILSTVLSFITILIIASAAMISFI